MAATIEFVLDCNDGERTAAFWAAALHYRPRAAVGQYRSLVDPEGMGPKLIIQQVAEPKTVKNRMHLDIQHPDIEAEAARLEALGARRLRQDPFSEAGTAWILMADPEGNEFCVCQSP